MTAALAVVVVVFAVLAGGRGGRGRGWCGGPGRAFAWITALCAAGIDARVLIVPTSQQAFIDEMQRAKDTR